MTALLTLSQPRTDTPLTLPAPAQFTNVTSAASTPQPPAPNSPMLPTQQGFVLLAAKHDLELSPPGSLPAVQARVASIKTVAHAGQYIAEVNQRSQQAQRAVKAQEAAAAADKSCSGKVQTSRSKAELSAVLGGLPPRGFVPDGGAGFDAAPHSAAGCGEPGTNLGARGTSARVNPFGGAGY